jgi:hypothetical protein
MDNLILACAVMVLAGCSSSASRGQMVDDPPLEEAGGGSVEAASGGGAGRVGATAPEPPSGGAGGAPGGAGGDPGAGGEPPLVEVDAGRAGEAGAPGVQCEPLTRDEACGAWDCCEVSDGCGAAMLSCGTCGDGLACVGCQCVDPDPPPPRCSRRADLFNCEIDAAQIDPGWEYPELWTCDGPEPPAGEDCADPVDELGLDVAAGVWCCR